VTVRDPVVDRGSSGSAGGGSHRGVRRLGLLDVAVGRDPVVERGG
jgi:hypothetical protein